MFISYPRLTVTCYYPYLFLWCVFLVSRVKILFGFIQKTFWEWKVFVTKLKWNTLTCSIYSSVMWGLLCTVWNNEIILPLSYCACVCVCVCVCVCERERERETECFPIKWDLVIAPDPLGVCHLQWVKLRRSWRYHFGDHSNPRNVLYILTRGAYDFRLLERHDIYPVFHSFLPLYKRGFENVSRNDSNTQMTRHLQVTSWSKIQDTLLHTKSRII